jgi:hypothetical protein
MRSTGGGAGSSSTLPPVSRWYQSRADRAPCADSSVRVASQAAGSGRPARFQRVTYRTYWSSVSSVMYREPTLPSRLDKERTGRYQGPDYYTID